MKPTAHLQAGALCILISCYFLSSPSLCSLSDACYFLWNFQISHSARLRSPFAPPIVESWKRPWGSPGSTGEGMLFPLGFFDEQGEIGSCKDLVMQTEFSDKLPAWHGCEHRNHTPVTRWLAPKPDIWGPPPCKTPQGGKENRTLPWAEAWFRWGLLITCLPCDRNRKEKGDIYHFAVFQEELISASQTSGSLVQRPLQSACAWLHALWWLWHILPS